ncbi:unnamed protein product [Clonostachys byssicola]|uniref:Uncharacterized protein n=1 Tax=Clonostachys byssicola TaxID=160290 RepID=A0A9N9U1M8_9HYPO|nr:unnamed protein product [Clonostachys byssicola]
MQSLGHSAQRGRKHIVEEKQKNEANLKENEGYIAQNTALMKQQKADLDAKAEAEKAADKERKEKQIAAENVLKGWDTRKEKEAAAVAGNKAIGEDSTQLDQLTDDESS